MALSVGSGLVWGIRGPGHCFRGTVRYSSDSYC